MKNFYPKKPSKCLDYLDKNNFYDWRMSSYLSYGGFKCLKNFDILIKLYQRKESDRICF